MSEHLDQPQPSPTKHRDFMKLPLEERRRQMEAACTPELVAEYAPASLDLEPPMTDPDQTHTIYDGLNLRQVIALHQQALGEISILQLEACKGRSVLADQAEEIKRLEKLAYIGEHHFEDNTHKARLDEIVPQYRLAYKQISAAYGYASRLFQSMAPQCELQPGLLGVLTQIDNAAAGRKARIRELELQREEGIAAILRADADLAAARATIHQLQTKCEKIPGYMAQAEAHRTLLMERDAQLAALVAEIRGIAEESILPDGDGVTTPVALWAESVLERFSALAEVHDLAIRAEAYEAGRAAEKAAQQAAYWADRKMPAEPTYNDRETP